MATDLTDNVDVRAVKVSSSTTPSELAHAVCAMLREGHHVRLDAIGHGAVGQAAKACAILNTLTANRGDVYLVYVALRDVVDASKPGGAITVTSMRLIKWAIGG